MDFVSCKKTRKPYTITKSRETWSEMEHERFIEALHLYDRDWKKIESYVGSKTVIQIRSHAQKYFLKVQKSGKNEHVPPPRPKRKALHPYPHKQSKLQKDGFSTSNSVLTNGSETSFQSLSQWPMAKTNTPRSLTVTPDFSQVYRFIAGVFDPHSNVDVNMLKRIDPINIETVLLLMRNMTINLNNLFFLNVPS